MTPERDVWKIIDTIINDFSNECEAIHVMQNGFDVQVCYDAIKNHRLHRHHFILDMKMLQTVTIPTLRLIIREILLYLRHKD